MLAEVARLIFDRIFASGYTIVGEVMNFNHLVSRYDLLGDCSNESHAYYPTGHIEAMIGDNVAVRLKCKHCGKVCTTFLKSEEYAIHHNVLEKYIQDYRRI